jgi:hypothetical protein
MNNKPDAPHESKFYEGIQLYRDDIELILSIFNENKYTTQITDNEFLFDSLDELIDKRGITPTDFEIHGKREENIFEYIRISFNKKQIYIQSNSYAHPQGKVIFAKISDICESRM